MSKYPFTVVKEVVSRCVFEVEASDEEEALEKADRAYEHDWDVQRAFQENCETVEVLPARLATKEETIDAGDDVIALSRVAWSEQD